MFEIVSICNGGGYRYCRTNPPHPKANAKGLYPLHRVLMENHIGRLLRDDEDVHHKDENKSNDDIGNLELLGHSDHAKLHNPEADDVPCTCPCGKVFFLKPHLLRQRKERAKTAVCCSRSCAVKVQFGRMTA